MENGSQIKPCVDDNNIGGLTFSLTKIGDVQQLNASEFVDVAAVVVSIKPTEERMTQFGHKVHVRTCQLVDQSLQALELTLWGAFCDDDGDQLNVRNLNNT